MFALPKLTGPMDANALAATAEELRRTSEAVSRLSGAVMAFERVTGIPVCIARSDQPEPSIIGVDIAKPGSDCTVVAPITAGDPPGTVQEGGKANVEIANRVLTAEGAGTDEKPKTDPRTAVAAAAKVDAKDAESNSVKVAPKVPANLKLEKLRLQGLAVPIREHLMTVRERGGKWGFAQDEEILDRAIAGQDERTIADVMEFSPSFIRQRFSKLVDRTHGQGNRFKREDVHVVLKAMLAEGVK